MVDFGERLRQLRTAKSLSQGQLAERLNVTKSVISAYEVGLRFPSYDILIKIARTFHVATDFLLGIDKRKFLDTSQLNDEQIEILSRMIDQFLNKK